MTSPSARAGVVLVLVIPGALGALAGCRAVGTGADAGMAVDRASSSAGADPAPELVEVFPFVRVAPDAGVVEIEGFVPIDAHDPETPDVYLEVVVCAVGTREHEALVATRARASHIHAALLLAGAEAGAPGAFEWGGREVVRRPPQGDELGVELIVPGELQVPRDPRRWIRDGRGRTLEALEGAPEVGVNRWVFAGSRFVARRAQSMGGDGSAPKGGARDELYDADGTGQIVGLHTFGSEVVAWSRVEHPDSSVDEPAWLAERAVVPKFGTPVVVRLLMRPRDGVEPTAR